MYLPDWMQKYKEPRASGISLDCQTDQSAHRHLFYGIFHDTFPAI